MTESSSLEMFKRCLDVTLGDIVRYTVTLDDLEVFSILNYFFSLLFKDLKTPTRSESFCVSEGSHLAITREH